ncbi:MAG: NTP transferase domain-containing protein [Candidatus Binatia bacterium]|nr:NTP transferase domain-containing protein [Candidatus Binatia bacterium]
MSFTPSAFTAFVLAGCRGQEDPLASEGRSKVLLPVAGVPMLVRVVRSVAASSRVAEIVISSDDPASLHTLPELTAWVESGRLRFHRSCASPAASVVDYVTHVTQEWPLLVTTADHPLLTTAMVDYFCEAACASQADVAVGVVAASLFFARYPHSRRTFIPLRGESFCGTNLFSLHTPRAVVAARFWAYAGQFRKRPWRLVSTFGLATLALFACRRLDLHAAAAHVSRLLGVQVAAVPMPFAECAIDVDNADDLALATQILQHELGEC